MRTDTSETESCIEKRTRRAATESMTIVALGRGEYKVYSGTRNAYVVDVIEETCECADAEYNHPDDGCKHRQRVEMELGQREIPDLGGRLDVEIMSGRERETEPAVATDGGMVAPEPQGSGDENTHVEGCDNPECEGIDADAERPLLSFECYEEWAAYDEEQLIEEAAAADEEGSA